MKEEVNLKKQKAMTPRCDICGRPEEHPVAHEFKGKIEWICYNCYKLKKGVSYGSNKY